MKQGLKIIFIIIISLSIFWLGFGYKKIEEPNTYYQVFLDGELIGTVTSQKKLEKYIDSQNQYIKNKYDVDTVYSPNGLNIEKIVTYDAKVDDISTVYERIKEKKAFTIKGYQLTIKDEEVEEKEKQTLIIYATNTDIFSEALENIIKTFVGTENYQNYLADTQKEIIDTGTIIENIYIQNTKTLKETYISTDEKIYTDSDELSQFLIFGENREHKLYSVKLGDTIESIAFDNQVSVEEILLSNDDITSSKNILYLGQQVKIAMTDPKVKVVTEEYVVEDVENKYTTIEKYDANLAIGNDKITQYGSNGIDRVTQNVERINGTITYVSTIDKIEIKPTVNEIIVIGQKEIPIVGSLTNWAWPTAGGWVITSTFGYRISPITGQRELHDALDIAGPGLGSPIYAANNGVVVKATYHYVNGNYVVINHNNGYYSFYGHMNELLVKEGQTVARGEQIGKMGETGWTTGPHVHFAIFYGYPYYGGTPYNPWTFY